jgi:hypothetical protein
MSGPFDALRPYFYIQWVEDCGKFWCARLEHRKKNTHRFAYRLKTADRPRLSPETSAIMLDIFSSEARRDKAQNSPPIGLKHRMRIYAREIMPARWRSHRKYMARQKEEKHMQQLPQFGMF